MSTKSIIALAAALILTTASAALAGDSGENHQDNDRSAVTATTGAGNAYGFTVLPQQTHRAVHVRSNDR